MTRPPDKNIGSPVSRRKFKHSLGESTKVQIDSDAMVNTTASGPAISRPLERSRLSPKRYANANQARPYQSLRAIILALVWPAWRAGSSVAYVSGRG